MLRRTFTDKDNAEKFVKARKAAGKAATITPIRWIRKGEVRTEYQVDYEK